MIFFCNFVFLQNSFTYLPIWMFSFLLYFYHSLQYCQAQFTHSSTQHRNHYHDLIFCKACLYLSTIWCNVPTYALKALHRMWDEALPLSLRIHAHIFLVHCSVKCTWYTDCWVCLSFQIVKLQEAITPSNVSSIIISFSLQSQHTITSFLAFKVARESCQHVCHQNISALTTMTLLSSEVPHSKGCCFL